MPDLESGCGVDILQFVLLDSGVYVLSIVLIVGLTPLDGAR